MRRKDSISRSRSGLGLPPEESGTDKAKGFRSRRLAEKRQSRRRRLARRILFLGAVASALLFLGIFLYGRIDGAGNGSEAPEPAPDGSGSGNVIMTVKDDAGSLSQIVVITAAGQQNGTFSLYAIPVRTVVDAPGLGFARLTSIHAERGPGALDQAVADLLQIPIQYHIDLSYAALKMAAERAGQVSLKTDRALTFNSGQEGSPLTLPAGDNPAGPDRALALLESAAAGGGDGPQFQAVFYQALRDALAVLDEADRKALARQLLDDLKTDMDGGEFVELFVEATAPERPFIAWALPVKAAGSGEGWYFEPLIDEIDMLMTGSGQDTAFRLEIQNGTETPGLVEEAAARLEPLLYETELKTDPSGVNFDFTQIRCGSDALAAGNRVQEILGGGTIIKDEYLEKNQIIVIIGIDMISGAAGTG